MILSTAQLEELHCAMDSSYAKLRRIVETLPYTDNRKAVQMLLEEAISDLKCFLNQHQKQAGDGVGCAGAFASLKSMDSQDPHHAMMMAYTETPRNSECSACDEEKRGSLSSACSAGGGGGGASTSTSASARVPPGRYLQLPLQDVDSPRSRSNSTCVKLYLDNNAFLRSQYGLANLVDAVADIDNCVQDVVQLNERESSIVYF